MILLLSQWDTNSPGMQDAPDAGAVRENCYLSAWQDKRVTDSLGIYISVPFCRSKCSYCNFASDVFPVGYHERYVARIIEEMRGIRRQASALAVEVPAVVDSIYLGGGTPSILAPNLLQQLFSALRLEFAVADNPEITLECAPGQLSDEFLAAMLDCGINRVSFGVQSFIDKEAAVTGRLHTHQDALRDIRRVKKAGLQSINADLIAGLPHQTAASWQESLDMLAALEIDHASVYMLEVDEDSRLGREIMAGGGRYHAEAVPTDDEVADFYVQAGEFLGQSDLAQYEISNFAQPGRESGHNTKYWLRQPYLGLGLDAHSMLRGFDGGPVRFSMTDDLQSFLNGAAVSDFQLLSRRQALEEAWFLGLRLNRGVSIARLAAEFGEFDVHSYNAVIANLTTLGLLELSSGWVRLTSRGRLMSNAVFERFLGDQPVAEPELIAID